jgi:hypothetical protein
MMWTKMALRAATGVTLMPLASCITVTDPNHGSHTGCNTWYNSIWQNKANLTLDHSDARSCPVTLQYGQQGSTGGRVIDNNAVYATTFDTNTLDVEAFDYDIGSGHDCQISLGFAQTASFMWQLVPPNNTTYQRRAEAFPSYTAGDSPDDACFKIDLWSELNDARAVITIFYNGNQV